jgi:hypothetical protein
LWSATAQAKRVDLPFPGDGVRTVVGTFEFCGATIVGVCFEAPNPNVEPYGIWLSADRLTENHNIFLLDYDDTVVVMPPSTSTTACGTTFRSIDHNGFTISFFMEDGDDTFFGGSGGVLKFDGGPGADRFHVYSSYMQIWANSGNDKIWNYTAHSFASYFYGQTGADCIQSRPGDYVNCGNDPQYIVDTTTASSAGSIGCESTGAYRCKP